MFKVGDRVYYAGRVGNGIITEDKGDDMFEVDFFWGKRMKCFSPRKIWQRRSPDKHLTLHYTDLTSTPRPTRREHSVGVGRTRSLDRLIQLIAEVPSAQGYNDINVNYGSGIYPGTKLSINQNCTFNKYRQCRKLGNLAPQVSPDRQIGWVAKPFHSMGGKNIYEINGTSHFNYGTHYSQQKITKVREFRTHCFLWHDRYVPIVQEKFVDDTDQLCWNEKQGGRFHYIHSPMIPIRKSIDANLYTRLVDLSVRALKLLKMDMGGIDFGLDENDKLWIFEVNTRMGIKEMSLATYKQVIWELHNLNVEKYKRERW